MKKYVIPFLVFTFIVLAGCSVTEDKESDKPIIYTSIYPIQYIVEQIAGDFVTVKSVYPPGVDAHTYEPASKDITEIAKGDAFIYLGAGMESFAETTRDALESQDISFVEIGENEDIFMETEDHGHEHEDEDEHEEGHEHDHHHEGVDPHIWLDPLRMVEMGEIIKNELVELYPEEKDYFNKNMDQLEKELKTLDTAFHDTLDHKKNKSLLVTHAAYGYWEEKYGIEQISINGLSSSDEPSQKELTNIAKIAKERELQYVIFDQAGSNRVSQIIQEHIGAEKRVIHNLEVLTEEDRKQKEDYISLMEKNLQILDEATK
ncbi:adhesin [Cerasibacillus terrae]|uniref:Adhesin n=1 Tax=Cerasibacillus terrae TaxID=2498845 RepID=A0A5C8NUT1_9BACI|nr:zinc ABC transporter substrate-binding protein [Cerasibacillus terrae]TXL64947.1 adhesin [Cerasibacillus terrae]